jgi:tetratricopeptide (TPR) repeat protein
MSLNMPFFDKIGLDKIGDRVGGFLDEVFLPEEVAQSLHNASRAMERGEYDAALRILYRTHAEQPTFHRTHHLIGLCYFHKGEFGKALSAFERAIAEREEAVSHLYAGLSAERLAAEPRPDEHQRNETPAASKSRRFHEAQVHFRRGLEAVGAGDLDFDFFFGLGRVYLGQGRADKAVRELKKAVKRRPGQPEATLMLARALVARQKLDEAREVLETPAARALGAGASVLRGELEEACGRHKAARAAYEHALQAAHALSGDPDETKAAEDGDSSA